MPTPLHTPSPLFPCRMTEHSTGQFSFSVVPNLTEDGEIAIDTLTDHESRVPFDEYIPMTEELIKSVFDNGEDYILNFVSQSF